MSREKCVEYIGDIKAFLSGAGSRSRKIEAHDVVF